MHSGWRKLPIFTGFFSHVDSFLQEDSPVQSQTGTNMIGAPAKCLDKKMKAHLPYTRFIGRLLHIPHPSNWNKLPIFYVNFQTKILPNHTIRPLKGPSSSFCMTLLGC